MRADGPVYPKSVLIGTIAQTELSLPRRCSLSAYAWGIRCTGFPAG